jgi:phage terminase large subunit GpA-like protein
MFPIASFEDAEPAQNLARRLSEEGFEAITNNDSGEQLLRFATPHPHAQWHVLVAPEKADDALARLRELDASEQILRFAIRCPDCGSTQVEYPQFSRNTIVGNIVPAAAAALGLMERQFYCTACHFTWSSPLEAAEGGDGAR